MSYTLGDISTGAQICPRCGNVEPVGETWCSNCMCALPVADTGKLADHTHALDIECVRHRASSGWLPFMGEWIRA